MSRYNMGKYELNRLRNDVWFLRIWMCETYAPLLKECFPKIEFKFSLGDRGTCSTEIRLTTEQAQMISNVLSIFKRHRLLIKNKNISPSFSDELDQCFALDFNREELPGTSMTEYTRYGALEHAAKENQDAEAREQLVEAFANLCENHPIYRRAKILMPIPPNPSKTFHLPVELARELAEKTGKKDGTALIRKVKETPKLQDLSLDQKVKALRGAIEITGDVDGKSVILIDDLYQSGSTMWTVAKLLKKNGAKRVLGLACVKSWRDTDNQ